MDNQEQKPVKESDDSFMTRQELIAFAFDVGFAIIIPLVIFVVAGRILDEHFHTSPLFLIAGLLISLISTGIVIYKKTKKFM